MTLWFISFGLCLSDIWKTSWILSTVLYIRFTLVKISMKFLKQFVLEVLLGSALLYWIAKYVPELGLIVQSPYKDVYVVFLFLWWVFWLVNVILKRIVDIITIPLKVLTLGLSWLLVNFLLFYVFEQLIVYLNLGIVVKLWSVIQVFILSCIMSLLYFLIKKIK